MSRHYLETRPVRADGTLGPAKPVSARFLQALAKEFHHRKEKAVHGAVPPNLLYADTRPGSERYIWWDPPQARPQYFAKAINMADGSYLMPGVVYLVERTRLSVWAFEGDRPDRDKPLLMGPFFNYYQDGSVCLGNAKDPLPPDVTWDDLIRHWERLFWNSVNSHTICNPMKGTASLIHQLTLSREHPFDTTTLSPTDLTLESLLQK